MGRPSGGSIGEPFSTNESPRFNANDLPMPPGASATSYGGSNGYPSGSFFGIELPRYKADPEIVTDMYRYPSPQQMSLWDNYFTNAQVPYAQSVPMAQPWTGGGSWDNAPYAQPYNNNAFNGSFYDESNFLGNLFDNDTWGY